MIEGTPDTDYEGGWYWGKITFPGQYPYKPPSLILLTPNGRFATNTQLCLSMTSFHPEVCSAGHHMVYCAAVINTDQTTRLPHQTWNPLWSVGTILNALLSFMHDDQPTTGAIVTSAAEKRQLAAASLAYNLKQPLFTKMFGSLAREAMKKQQNKGESKDGATTRDAGKSTATAVGSAGPHAAHTPPHTPTPNPPPRNPQWMLLMVSVPLVLCAIAVAKMFVVGDSAAWWRPS